MAGLLRRRRRRPGGSRTGERGVALITAVVVALAVFAVVGTAIEIGVHQEGTSAAARRRQQALSAAEAGVNAAMSRLSVDAGYTGADLATLAGGTGQYSVTVSPLSADPADGRRYITSVGYAPARDAPGAAVRRLEQEVALVATDGFRYALFTAPGGVTGANNATVNGDVYSATDLTLANRVTVSGGITSLGTVATTNNSTIGGDIRATGNVTVDNAATTVLGSVYSGGNVSLTGRVKGNVQAAGTISGGTVEGARAPYSPPDPPAAQTLPTFTWNPANYPSTQSWPTPAEFQGHWSASTDGFSGHHRVLCPQPCSGGIALDARWTMSGDVTIATDSPITLSREMANGAGRPVTLTIVSFSSASPAVTMSNNLSLPADIRVVFFAPNGPVRFTNLKNFSGAIYASSMILDQQFTLTFVPVSVPGFTWDVASARHFRIEARAFKEVPA